MAPSADYEAFDQTKLKDWYSKGISYWKGVEGSVEGFLGGYGCVNDAYVKGSEAFLKTLLPLRFGKEKRHVVALDCGAGIGRITKKLLLRHFNEVQCYIGYFLSHFGKRCWSEYFKETSCRFDI